MPLVFAAVAPHTPVLIPSVGKDHLKKMKKTLTGLHRLEQELLAAQPDVLVVIAPHGHGADDHFVMEVRESYQADLKNFGVFEVPLELRSDLRLASALKEQAEDLGIPLMKRTEADLDYGVIVPLLYLAPRLLPVSILPIFPSRLPLKSHFELGQAILEAAQHSDRRVAVIASVDLSQRLSRSSPAGYSPFGKKFDEKILAILREKKASSLVTFEEPLAEKAAQCALPALTVLSGIVEGMETAPEILSYESPFGVGVMTAVYKFS